MAVERTGKYLHAPLDDGQILVAHLGMSGRFTVNGPIEPHTHFTAVMEGGDAVRFIDPRTFGFIAVCAADEIADSTLGRLGPDSWAEPVDPGQLEEKLKNRTAPIKALLLDQYLVSGLGNIYADEALHMAGIHPARPGGSLRREDLDRLVVSIGLVLDSAIEHGGTSLDDLAYLLPNGRAGENLGRLAVYGRTDLPCFACGTPIRRIVLRSRSAHFCPVCQGEIMDTLVK